MFLYKNRSKQNKIVANKNLVVLITGCDSGLGHFTALKCYEEGFTVVATVLNKNSEGSKSLLKNIPKTEGPCCHVIEMDLKNDNSIKNVFDYISSNLQYSKLHSIINNAGVMCFGEFEWLTTDIIDEQIRVNLLGPMALIKYFLPMIRKDKSRIINVTSHCSLTALPGLSVYSASKAGLRFWTESLEKELYKFGVKVINFIPGSFIMSSNITARTMMLSKNMKETMSEEQLKVYEEYFDQYYGYLSYVSSYKSPGSVQFDAKIISKLMDAILDEFPKCVYKEEPWRYKLYYNLFKIIPQGPLEHYFVEKFMMMPKYKCTSESDR